MTTHGEMFLKGQHVGDVVKQHISDGIAIVNDAYNKFAKSLHDDKSLSHNDFSTICTSILMTWFANGFVSFLVSNIKPEAYISAIDAAILDLNQSTKEVLKIALKEHNIDLKIPNQKLDS